MSQDIRCPECHRGYHVNEQYSGRRFKCRRCKASIAIPKLESGTGITPLVIAQAWLGVALGVLPLLFLAFTGIEIARSGEFISPVSYADRGPIVLSGTLSILCLLFAHRNTKRTRAGHPRATFKDRERTEDRRHIEGRRRTKGGIAA